MATNASVSFFLDTRRIKKKTNKYPLKLRVYYQELVQFYTTIFDLSRDEYQKLDAKRVSDELQEIRETLKKVIVAANAVIDRQEVFSFDDFERDYIRNNPHFIQKKAKVETAVDKPVPVAEEFDFSEYVERFPIFEEDHSGAGCISTVYFSCIKRLLQEGRIGTARSYQDSYTSLKKFGGNLLFVAITPSFLYQYESWMLNQGRSKSTIGIYLRPLRATFNEAINDGLIQREKHYPFGRRKYQIPTSKNVKKALMPDTIADIYYDTPSCESEQRAKDFWFFCYFANGMNIKDVALLKYKNIQGEYLVFERAKTSRTTRTNPKLITVYINEDIATIIDRWGNKDRDPNNYIFPIFEQGISLLRQYDLNLLFVKFVNFWMAKICERLGIEKKATTIVTRHSFSTRLKQAGASTEFIQEALGHTEKKTTENYLDSFENDVKKEFAKSLAEFKRLPAATDRAQAV